MGQHGGHGLEVVLGDEVTDAVERAHPGVDDHALGPGGGGEDVAAGLPRPGRERRDEHSLDPIGQDGRMSDGDAPQPFGRVDPDGTVYVRTADGERAVGQVPDVPADEALAFFTRRYDALELEVSLLEKRVASKALSPDDAAGSIKTVRTAVTDANAVGDLDGLLTRLQALSPVVDEARAAQRAEKARQLDEVQGQEGARRHRGRGPGHRQRLARRGQPVPRRCSTTGRRSPGSTGPPTTRCGTASRPPVRPTPAAARRSSPSRTGSARAPARSRSSWSSRPRRSRPRPSGAPRPARTAT